MAPLLSKQQAARKSHTQRTKIVNSASPVPTSPPFGPIPATLISAKNSGKLLKHDALIECNPSLSSLSFLSARRHIESFQRGWSAVSAE